MVMREESEHTIMNHPRLVEDMLMYEQLAYHIKTAVNAEKCRNDKQGNYERK